MMTVLGYYIKGAMAKPFAWGSHDCCTFCAEWMGFVLGADLLGHWRGEYDNEHDALRLIEDRGGLVAIFDKQIAGRADRVAFPTIGSVGVIRVKDYDIGAVYSGQRWIVFAEEGMRAIPHKKSMVVAMWSAHA